MRAIRLRLTSSSPAVSIPAAHNPAVSSPAAHNPAVSSPAVPMRRQRGAAALAQAAVLTASLVLAACGGPSVVATDGGSGGADAGVDGGGEDLCPLDPAKTEPGTCGCGVPDADGDADGVFDCEDGCPDDPRKIDEGYCGCGVRDTDLDADGVVDCRESCPDDPDKTEPGLCGCGVPDADSDGDGPLDCEEGCPDDPDKTDAGACGCGVPDTDSDADGTADCLDGCPDDPGKIEPRRCGCGTPDADADADGTPDCVDQCPGAPDTDTDGDGTADCNDLCPEDAAKLEPGVCGCHVSDVDTDSDGVPDCEDQCPGRPDTDADLDGTADCVDRCGGVVDVDPREDDDTAATAGALTAGEVVDGSLCLDDDWYALDLPAGAVLTALLEINSGATAAFELRDSGGALLAKGADDPAGLSLVYLARDAGTYLLKVAAASPASYRLSTEVLRAAACPADDAWEENDTRYSAPTILSGHQLAGVLCPGDPDLFAVDLSGGDAISAHLAFEHSRGDLDLQLTDAAGGIVAQSASVDDDESLHYVAPTSGRYYLNVQGYGGAANGYLLRMLTGPGAPSCPGDDPYENNDSRVEATVAFSGARIHGVACGNDQDYYAVHLEAGERIFAALRFSHSVADLDLRLYDPNGSLIQSALGFDDDETLAHRATTSGWHYLRAGGYGSSARYVLAIDVDDDPLLCPADDRFEANDDRGTATALPVDSVIQGVLCSGSDWYEVVVPAGATIHVNLEFVHADGNLDMRIYNSWISSDRATSTTDDEFLSYTASGEITKSIEVYGAPNVYGLSVHVVAP